MVGLLGCCFVEDNGGSWRLPSTENLNYDDNLDQAWRIWRYFLKKK